MIPGATYYYWLETVTFQGATARFGPVSAVFVAPTAVTLTSIHVQHVWPAWLALIPLFLVGALLAYRRRPRAG
ncbi:MAG: hypothetical protein HZY76_23380 [Anaerolineae bacterium]|nr:MAG: hypothetical protein HZY76_23380 [Anaerolineae bacterium]